MVGVHLARHRREVTQLHQNYRRLVGRSHLSYIDLGPPFLAYTVCSKRMSKGTRLILKRRVSLVISVEAPVALN